MSIVSLHRSVIVIKSLPCDCAALVEPRGGSAAGWRVGPGIVGVAVAGVGTDVGLGAPAGPRTPQERP